jgi:bisphosphoglycerate-independent phosphoglycerate mutase (AlkP superfamily)
MFTQPRGAIALAEGVKALYAEGQTDYSLDPIVLVDNASRPIGRIADGDAVIFCCRRGEREIELTEAFTQSDFLSRKICNPAGCLCYSEDQTDARRSGQPRRLASTAHLRVGEVRSRYFLLQRWQ